MNRGKAFFSFSACVHVSVCALVFPSVSPGRGGE